MMEALMRAILDLRGLIQIATAIAMIRIVFGRMVSRFRSLITGLLCIAGLLLINGIFNYFVIAGSLPDIVGFLIYYLLMVAAVCLYGHLALDVPRQQLIMTSLFQVGNVLVVFMLVSLSLNYLNITDNTGTGTSTTLYYLLLYSICTIGLLFLALLYQRVTEVIRVHLSGFYWFLIDLTQILNVLLVANAATGAHSADGILHDIILLIVDFTIYLLMIRFCQEMEQQLETQKANQNLQFQIRQIDNERTTLENVRKVRHELRNNYFYIETLIREGKDEDALRYMEEVIKPSFRREEMVQTGNHLVDMILSQKVSEARQEKIPISLDVHLPAELSVNPEMLCSLLFNLLNNAIEASRHVTHPQITCVMHQLQGYLNIQVSNHIDRSVLHHNPELHTSKKDSQNHGIGMSMIREVVRRYNGNLRINEQDGKFIVNVMLANAA